MYSLTRDNFNETELESLDIKYIINNNSTSNNYLDVILQYQLKGKNTSQKIINSLIINTSIDYCDNLNNIKATAQDCRNGKNSKIIPNYIYDESFQVITWTFPFNEKGVEVNNEFEYCFSLDWKCFFDAKELTQILIDPKNYSSNTKSINLSIENKSNLMIKQIQVYKFTRTPFDKQEPIILNKNTENTWKGV